MRNKSIPFFYLMNGISSKFQSTSFIQLLPARQFFCSVMHISTIYPCSKLPSERVCKCRFLDQVMNLDMFAYSNVFVQWLFGSWVQYACCSFLINSQFYVPYHKARHTQYINFQFLFHLNELHSNMHCSRPKGVEHLHPSLGGTEPKDAF